MPVARDPIVLHVALYHRPQVGSLSWNRVMHSSPKLGLHLLQLRLHPSSHRLPPYRKPSLLVLLAAMREAQKVERLGFPFAPLLPLLVRIPAKPEQPRLVRV